MPTRVPLYGNNTAQSPYSQGTTSIVSNTTSEYTNQANIQPTIAHRPAEFNFDNINEKLDIPIREYIKNGDDNATKYEFMPFIRQRIYQNTNTTAYTPFLAGSLIILSVLLISSLTGNSSLNFIKSFIAHRQEVAHAQDITDTESNHYRQWAQAIDFGTNLNAETKNADPDNDGLTNYEEYLLQSNPLKSQSCPNITSDIGAFIDLLNPGTCREVDWENETEIKNYLSVFTTKIEYRNFIDNFSPDRATEPKVILSTTDQSLDQQTTDAISAYIKTVAPTSTFDPQLITQYSQRYSIQPELLLAFAHYGSDFGTRSTYRDSNITAIGTTQISPYGFSSPESNIATTAQLIRYLEMREVPDCAQISLIYGGDLEACAKIQTIYQAIAI